MPHMAELILLHLITQASFGTSFIILTTISLQKLLKDAFLSHASSIYFNEYEYVRIQETDLSVLRTDGFPKGRKGPQIQTKI